MTTRLTGNPRGPLSAAIAVGSIEETETLRAFQGGGEHQWLAARESLLTLGRNFGAWLLEEKSGGKIEAANEQPSSRP